MILDASLVPSEVTRPSVTFCSRKEGTEKPLIGLSSFLSGSDSENRMIAFEIVLGIMGPNYKEPQYLRESDRLEGLLSDPSFSAVWTESCSWRHRHAAKPTARQRPRRER